ncbi:MAG: winged helix-turn-helix transcriptional regulator [Candidatus Izemoplasmatales bacterium]|nr:winged helix-turn-helix transcriptional regulator [Candidatus Izemoplasmatales bacterium]
MVENLFFKPTPLYKEYLILDLIEKRPNITQRILSDSLGVSVSMINYDLDEYEDKGFIRRKYYSSKNVEYILSKKGIEQRKLLNIRYLISSHMVYESAKDNIITFMKQIANRGFKKILLYGAGEVAEIMLHAMNNDISVPLDVLAVIDDDDEKQGRLIVNHPIIPISLINQYDHDGILIASYTHHQMIRGQLLKHDYPYKKIIEFF